MTSICDVERELAMVYLQVDLRVAIRDRDLAKRELQRTRLVVLALNVWLVVLYLHHWGYV